jgi:diguanylate cyclase (GGDEF)-like protein/PAS domain S-box-containing protein
MSTSGIQTQRLRPGTRYYVLALILITVLPVIALIFYNDLEDRHEARKQGRNQAMGILRAIHLKQENIIESTDQVLTALGQLPAIQEHDRAACTSLLNSLLGRYRQFSSLSAFKPDGELFCSAPRYEQQISIAGQPHYQQALESRQLTTSNYIISNLLEKPALFVIKPILDSTGEPLVLVDAAIDLSWLNTQIQQLPLYDFSILTIFDAQGTVLMQYPSQDDVHVGDRFAETEVVTTAVKLRHLGVLERSDAAGVEYIHAYAPLGGHDINAFVAVSIPADVVLAGANEDLRHNLLMLTIVTVIAILIAFSWSHRFFVNPMRRLAEAATQVRHGKLNINVAGDGGPAELLQLGTAFNQMTEALQRRADDQERIEHALSQLIQQHRNATPTEFLVSLTSILADSLDSKYCLIALLDPAHPEQLKTRVLWANGSQLDNISIALENSPHEELIERERFRIYRNGVRRLFPDSPLLNELEVDSYAGITLTDFDQKVRGLLVVMNDQPIRSDEMFHSLLQIFAARVTAELEREDMERQRLQLLDEARLAATAFESHEAMFITDAQHRILRVNRAFIEITGYDEAFILGKRPKTLLVDDVDEEFCERMWNETIKHTKWSGEVEFKCRNGKTFTANLTVSAVIPASDERISHFVAHFQDVTERKLAEARIQHLAYHDDLTELPNRTLLLDRLEKAMARLRRHGTFGALMFIDLDHFKNINDSLGHPVGDGLLIQISERLRQHLRQEDTVARLGGDEFVVLLPELNDNKDLSLHEAHSLAGKLLDILSDEYNVAGHTIKTSVSIGIVLFPERDLDADDILRHADMAMYSAKGAGRSSVRIFEPEMQARLIERLKIEDELRKAYEKNQFVLYHQPQVKLDTNAIIGSEVLLRWQHPVNGLTVPGAFIAILEESGLIQPVGQWVLREACATLAENSLLANHVNQPVMAVNISPRQFLERDFVDYVIAQLDEFGIEGERLELEITERAVIKDVDETIRKMKRLREYGVRFSIDDFGTGYSSLAYIKQLPIDTLKIDRSFIQDCLTDANDKAIVRAIASMANSLELGIIAEGVETREQLEFLKQIGCQAYQGYYYSHPLPEAQFNLLLKENDKVA